VRAFGRQEACPEEITGVEWFRGNFNDPQAVNAAVESADIVIHAVSTTTPHTANLDKTGDIIANVVSTVHLLEACRNFDVQRIIFLSSGGTVYGIPSVVPTPESAETAPISAYGISKLSIEKYLALYHHLYGLEYRILRIANPFGPHQEYRRHRGVITAFLNDALNNKPVHIWGDGSIVRDYIYVDDLVNAIILSMTHQGKDRVFNIGSGEGRTLNELVAALERSLKRPVPVQYFETRATDVPCSILDISLAQEKLGWRPQVPFEQGLDRTIAWARGYNALARKKEGASRLRLAGE
jgi:UDP-glucose 4-epimerase